jgi:hypothetical protein
MKSQAVIRQNYYAVRAERLALASDEDSYEKGHIDGMYIALQWVLSDGVGTLEQQ